jgi:hypothetical protein
MTLIVFVLPILFGACASTSTKKISLTAEEIEAEEGKQRVVVLESIRNQQERLANVAYPILVSATPLCPDDIGTATGFLFENLYSFNKDWREAARIAFDSGEELQVLACPDETPASKAGLRTGDILVTMNGSPVPVGEGAAKDLWEWLRGYRESGERSLDLEIKRGGEMHAIGFEMDTCCAYPTIVIQGGGINAFADGERIFMTTPMMRFANDEELAVVIAHEMAHNAMDHLDAKKQNALLGGIFGAILDAATAATTGYSTGGYYTGEMASVGATAYSQDFETEADYVGMYALALAGHKLEGAPYFWRQMAQVSPDAIGKSTQRYPVVRSCVPTQRRAETEARERGARVDSRR